jgi:hypothetical protein
MKTEKITVETAFEHMLNWSVYGCTINGSEAKKLLKPLSHEELAQLHGKFGAHYNAWAPNVADELEVTEIGTDGLIIEDDEDAVCAIEEMHDAIKARSLISYVVYAREAQDKKTRTIKPRRKAA